MRKKEENFYAHFFAPHFAPFYIFSGAPDKGGLKNYFKK
jgi:hypothetical protein